MSVQSKLKEVATKFAVAALSDDGGRPDPSMNADYKELLDTGVSVEQFDEAMRQANREYVASLLDDNKGKIDIREIKIMGDYARLINATKEIENPVIREAAKEFTLSILGSEVRGIAHDIYGRKIDRNDAWNGLAQNAEGALRAAVKGDFANAADKEHGDKFTSVNRFARDYHFGTRDKQIGTAAKLLKLAVLEHGQP